MTSFLLLILIFVVTVKANAIVTFVLHLIEFLKWKMIDFKQWREDVKNGVTHFRLYGLTCFVGRQGGGKTVSLIQILNEAHIKYPDALIYTNFKYKYATGQLESLNDLLTIRNGTDGVIFAIDELQNEFSSNTSKDFPETLLSTITMQRKQCVKIYATSQVFTRVSKPLREQCYEVVECRTFMSRWTRMKCYDADDYNLMIDSNDIKAKHKTPKKWKRSFIQTDDMRNCYDTYEVIQRLSRQGFKEKNNMPNWY